MESKIVFGKMIDYYRKKNGFTMEELGSRLGKTKSTISRWISGERYPKIEEVEQIAVFFDTDVHTLVFGGSENTTTTLTQITDTTAKLEEPRQEKVLTYAQSQLKEQEQEQEQEQANDNVLQFPVSKVIDELEEEPKKDVDIQLLACAGHGTINFDKENPIETVVLPENNVPSYYDYACKIVGSSMEPMYHDGEVIFLRRSPNIRNNMIAVVEINDQCFLKKMTREGNKLRLISLNDEVDTNGDPIFPDFYADANDDIYIVGEVIK